MDWDQLDVEPGRSLALALAASPRDRDAWAVFGDFVAEHDARLGERIALELRRARSSGPLRSELTREIRELDRWRRREWMGPELLSLLSRKGKFPTAVQVQWRFGFIEAIRLQHSFVAGQPEQDHILTRLLASPYSRFVSRVSIELSGSVDTRARVWDTICVDAPRPSLRELDIQDPTQTVLLELDPLLRWAPRLEQLRVGGRVAMGALRHPTLRTLSLLSRESVTPSLAGTRASLPQLDWLGVALRGPHMSPPAALEFIRALVIDGEFPCLAHLHVEARGLGDLLVELLQRSGWFERLLSLAIPNCGLSDRGAAQLQIARRGPHSLTRIECPGNRLSAGALADLRYWKDWEVVTKGG